MEQIKRLELQSLSKTFFTDKGYFTAIEDVSFDVYDGEFLVILGPGRCGKTIMLNIIAGLENPSEGKIYYNGKEWKGLNPEIGMVFQKLALMSFKTVIENVELSLKFRGMKKRRGKRSHVIISTWLAWKALNSIIRINFQEACSNVSELPGHTLQIQSC